MHSTVRTNFLLRVSSYLVVSSRSMAASRNMYEPDKVKYTSKKIVNLLILSGCNHS
jgi:hypothetical protein